MPVAFFCSRPPVRAARTVGRFLLDLCKRPMPMTLRMLHFGLAIGLSACLMHSGCGSATSASATAPPPKPGESDTDAAERGAFDGAVSPILSADQLPLRIAGKSAAPSGEAGNPDDVRGRNTLEDKPGLIDTLRGTIEGSPVFEESGAQESLLDSLDAAQDELRRVKRDNRRALRNANRQQRVGSAARVPHLLLITISDIGYADLGCYGGHSATPKLDAFAAQGTRFTNFYAASASPRRSRLSLLTGLNAGHAPVRTSSDTDVRFTVGRSSPTVAEVLWQSGYATAFVGVWRDSVSPLDYGNDQWSGVLGRRTLDPFGEYAYIDGARARLTANAEGKRGLASAEFLIEEAVASLNRMLTGGRPGFLHFAVSPQLMPVVESGSDPAVDQVAQISEFDARLGRFLSRLDSSGLANQFCILIAGESTPRSFTSGAADERVSRAGGLKTSPDGLSDGNLRVPLLVRWPKRVASGTVSEHVCAVWDLLPTLAELAAAHRKPQRLDGVSFASELTGRPQRAHSMLYWETQADRFGQAVRKGRWKAVRAPGQTTLALYDLDADPNEQHDIAELHPDVVRQFIVSGR